MTSDRVSAPTLSPVVVKTPTGPSSSSIKKDGFANLVDALEFAARGDTGYNFYDGKGELESTMTYAELRDEAKLLARKLLGLGLQRGDRVAIVAETDPLFMRFFFASQYAGLLPVALPAGLQLGGGDAWTSQIRQMLQTCGAAIAVAPSSHSKLLTNATEGLELTLCGEADVFDALPEDHNCELLPFTGNEPAYLQYTSGSTSFPRGVEVSQAAAMMNLEEISKFGLKLDNNDRFVSWLPFYHDMGLVGFVLLPMAAQLSADYLSPRTFAMRPRVWLKLLSDNSGTIASSPPFGYALVAKRLRVADSERYDLSKWRAACVGAERIHPGPLKQFADLLKASNFNPKSFIACYGMAECALAVSFAPLNEGLGIDLVDKYEMTDLGKATPAATGQNPKDSLEFVDCGNLLPSYQLAIRDDAGNELPERECGRICLQGPSVMTGYFQNKEATDKVLSADGWLDTGDIGYRIGDQLVITARRKDVIIINGRNIWPQDLEHIAEGVPKVRMGNVSAFSVNEAEGHESVIMVVESRHTEPELAEELQSRIQGQFGVSVHVDLVPSRTLPRTSSGKLSRSRAKIDYLQRLAATKMAELEEANSAAVIAHQDYAIADSVA